MSLLQILHTLKSAPRYLAIVLLSVFFAIDASAQSWQPKAFKAEYVLTKGGLILGEVTRELKRVGVTDKFVYKSTSHSSGFMSFFIKDKIIEQSVWILRDANLKPLEYFYSRSGGKKQRKVNLSFDWRQKRVSNLIAQDQWTMTIPDNAQDKLLYQLTLMRDLQNDRSELAYLIPDRGELKIYRFDRLQEEDIDTPLGKLHTIALQWSRDDRVTKLWCAPEYNYLPVQIEQEENGQLLNLTLKAITGLPQ